MLDWSQIENVFLDLDGTLLDLHFDNHFWLEYVPQCYAEHHQLSRETTQKILDKKYADVYGRLNWYCVDYWTRELELDIAALKEQVSHKIAVRPHVEEFLEALHMHGKQVSLVTNAHPVSIQIKMHKTRLDRFFHRVVTSHQLHHAKEEQAFWQGLEQLEPFDRSSTLFIDDNFSVLDAAREFGIGHLLAIKQPDSQGELKQHHHYPLLETFEEIMPA